MTQHNTSYERTPWYFHFGVLFGLLISVYYSMHQVLTGDQIQMLQKGYLAAHQNIWLHYGNAASAMGNVPGTLSTLLIALPLQIVDSPYSPMVLLLVLRLVGFLLIDAIIKNVFSLQVRILFLLICWLNPWFQFESLLYNPSYLFFCSALHFWTAFQLRDKSNWFYSFLHILSIGLALQLHYSWPLLVLISSYLYVKKYIQISWFGVLTAVITILVSLLPYITTVMHEPTLLENPDQEAHGRYIGWGGVHVYPVLKSFLYWLRYASLLYPNKLLNTASFDWVTEHETLRVMFVYLWRTFTYAIGGLTVIVAGYANFICWQKIKSQILERPNSRYIESDNWVIHYAFGAVLAVVIAAILSPIVLIYWHLMLVFPFALFPILILAQNKNLGVKKTNQLFVACLCYFLLVNFVASNDSKKYSIHVDYKLQTLNYLNQNQL